MAVFDPKEAKVGLLLIRRSALTDIPVIISEVGEETFTVKLRDENLLHHTEAMTIGMMELGIEGSPVYALRNVEWKYSLTTGDEIDPYPGLDSILLKP